MSLKEMEVMVDETLNEIRLAKKAVAQRWPIDGDTRQRIVDRLLSIMEIGEPGEIVAAAKALAAMDKQTTDLQEATELLSTEELQAALVQRYLQQKDMEVVAKDLPRLSDARTDEEVSGSG